MTILYKNLFKHVILRGHIFIFLQITVVIKIYCTFKIEKNVYHKNFVFFSFLQLDYIRGYILNILRTIFTKLIFHRWLKIQLANLLLWKFYRHSTYLISHCIRNNFSPFLSKINQWFLLRNKCFGEFTFIKFGFSKKKQILPNVKSQCAFFSV